MRDPEVKMPAFEAVVEEQEFAGSKNANRGRAAGSNSGDVDSEGFLKIPDAMEELPFH